jgi:uncharacterized protein YlzI (FlbEa/FlbD family)
MAHQEEEKMIVLHKLSHTPEPLYLNPDLIQVVEARPDTHVVLTTGGQLTVSETPAEVAEAVFAYRVGILAAALRPDRDSSARADFV